MMGILPYQAILGGVSGISPELEMATNQPRPKPPVFPEVNGMKVSKIVTQEQVDLLKGLELFPDDLWVVTYPKAGTTWMQQIVKLIHSNGEEDGRKSSEAVPWIEAVNNPDPKHEYNFDISSMKSPRAFKSHFTYDLMPCGVPSTTPCKYIYVSRNPRDLAVSYYFHYLGFKYVESLEWSDFFSWFSSGSLVFGDYFKHTLSWWDHREDDNVLFLKYEDMKRDLRSSIRKISLFMGVELSSDIVNKIADESTFSKMKNNPGANYTGVDHRRAPDAVPFMRRGEVGDWKNFFTSEQIAECDALCCSKFKPAGLEFDYEL